MANINIVDSLNPVIQIVYTSTSSLVDCSTAMPFDDTIPQNTEGDEVLTLAITPSRATNILHILFHGFALQSALAMTTQFALFQDATADALAASASCYSGSNNADPGGDEIILSHYMAAGTTSSTTFKIRVGPSANNSYVNGDDAGNRLYGGVANTILTITEFFV